MNEQIVSKTNKLLITEPVGRVSKLHWPEYSLEAFGLALFMISACLFGVVFEHPASPVRQMIGDATFRRVLFAVAMGLTAVLNIYSPWGKRSGAHFNPATTLTFWRLGKVETCDAIFYALFQFAGGVSGVLASTFVLGGLIAHPAVNYVATFPGETGAAVAFAAETGIAFILIIVVLTVSNSMNLARYTGLFAGVLVMAFISIEAPISGMSMNPARTLASAVPAGIWTAIWVYFTAPPIGMLLGAEAFQRLSGEHRVYCAKLHHFNDKHCIFRCNFKKLSMEYPAVPAEENKVTLKEERRYV